MMFDNNKIIPIKLLFEDYGLYIGQQESYVFIKYSNGFYYYSSMDINPKVKRFYELDREEMMGIYTFIKRQFQKTALTPGKLGLLINLERYEILFRKKFSSLNLTDIINDFENDISKIYKA